MAFTRSALPVEMRDFCILFAGGHKCVCDWCYFIAECIGFTICLTFASQHKGWKIHASSCTFWSKNSSKRPGANNDRKVFELSKCVARFIHASQKPSHWSPLLDWMLLTKWLNNNWFKEDLVSVYCLTTSVTQTDFAGPCDLLSGTGWQEQSL